MGFSFMASILSKPSASPILRFPFSLWVFPVQRISASASLPCQARRSFPFNTVQHNLPTVDIFDLVGFPRTTGILKASAARSIHRSISGCPFNLGHHHPAIFPPDSGSGDRMSSMAILLFIGSTIPNRSIPQMPCELDKIPYDVDRPNLSFNSDPTACVLRFSSMNSILHSLPIVPAAVGPVNSLR